MRTQLIERNYSELTYQCEESEQQQPCRIVMGMLPVFKDSPSSELFHFMYGGGWSLIRIKYSGCRQCNQNEDGRKMAEFRGFLELSTYLILCLTTWAENPQTYQYLLGISKIRPARVINYEIVQQAPPLPNRVNCREYGVAKPWIRPFFLVLYCGREDCLSSITLPLSTRPFRWIFLNFFKLEWRLNGHAKPKVVSIRDVLQGFAKNCIPSRNEIKSCAKVEILKANDFQGDIIWNRDLQGNLSINYLIQGIIAVDTFFY